ncbi:MAG: S8 family serine peptidase [Chthoniobacterales bacterium]|nr:S8 family serine peptidase [Chthoniobacterales bacterium]
MKINTHTSTSKFAAGIAIGVFLTLSALASDPKPNAQSPSSGTSVTTTDGESLSATAASQVEAILRDKKAWTPAQKKISSNLIYAARMAGGKEALPGIASLKTGVTLESDKVLVDIRAQVSPEVLELVKSKGGEIEGSYVETDIICARVPLAALEELASDHRVRAIRLPKVPMLESKTTSPTKSGYGRVFDQLVAATTGTREASQLSSVSRSTDAFTVPGFRASVAEGDIRHRSRDARLTFGIDGSQLKVGVISDSFDAFGGGYRKDVRAGDLPGPNNPNGYTKRVLYAGSGDFFKSYASDEGRAMAQIIHAVLPGAQIYFATGFKGYYDMAHNIRALRGIAKDPGPFGNVPDGGCDIIVDDIGYSQEAALRDGSVKSVFSPSGIADLKQAVLDVVNDGALYFSSAANSGNINDRQSGTWEGDFADGGAFAGARFHNFNTGRAPRPLNLVTNAGNFIALEWSDALGVSKNDYDLIVFNNAGNKVVGIGADVQDGDDDPTEGVYGPAEALEAGAKIAIVKAKGAAVRFLSMYTGRGRLNFVTDGQTRGHATAPGAYAVAATPTSTNVGPSFPLPFDSTNQVEQFSSDGFRRVFFDEYNIPFNGRTLATGGGIVRIKPDLTGADGAPTSVFGFERFYGTSAAAPHAAAIAGLVRQGLEKSGVNSPTLLQVRDLLQSTATDIEAPGVDRDAGYGIVDAFKAVNASNAPGGAGIDIANIVANETGENNGNGRLDPGEAVSMRLPLINVGLNAATGVAGTLSTDTPGVSIPDGDRVYGDIAPNETAGSFSPFSFSLDPSFQCSRTIRFQLVLNFGGAAPNVVPLIHNFELETGLTGIRQFFTRLNRTPPKESPVYTAITGKQIGRLLGTGVASTCETRKPVPPKSGSFPDSPRRYDAYTIMNQGPARCITVTYNPPQANPPSAPTNFMGCAAYKNFNPEDVQAGYLGDAGFNYVSNPGGFADVSYSFIAPADAPFTVVVFETNPGAAGDNPPTSNTYGLAVEGLVICDP